MVECKVYVTGLVFGDGKGFRLTVWPAVVTFGGGEGYFEND